MKQRLHAQREAAQEARIKALEAAAREMGEDSDDDENSSYDYLPSRISSALPLHGFLEGMERNSLAAIRDWDTSEVAHWARIRELPLAVIAQIRQQSVDGERLCGWVETANRHDRMAFVTACVETQGAEKKDADGECKSDADPTSPAGRSGALSPCSDAVRSSQAFII